MDPFSVATGAAGLISLGLTVSGGLIQYCKDYRSQDADLTQLSQHAQELNSFLILIEKRTTGPHAPDGDIHATLQGCRDACDACLENFKRLNDKYASPKLGRSRKLVRNLKYPFDKRKFEDVRSRFREFNAALLGHLHDVTRSIRIRMISESDRVTTAVEAMGRQFHSSILSSEHALNDTIRDGTDQLEMSFQRGLQITENNVVTAVDEKSDALMQRLDQVVQMLQSQNQMQATSISIDNRMALGISNMSNSRLNTDVTRKLPSEVPVRSFFCDCPVRYGHSNMQHRKGCLYSFSNRKKRTFALSLGAFRRQIIATCQIEYSLLAWARDWRIHPNLTFRATVWRGAPAFETIRRASKAINNVVTVKDLEETLRNCLVELQHIFTSGKGWPTDVDDLGRNLLHLAIAMAFSRDRSRILFEEEVSIIFVQFITALVQMGVPINDICEDFGTPLQAILCYMQWNSSPITGRCMANKLIDMDAVGGDKVYSPRNLLSLLSCDIADIYATHTYTEFLHDVLLRSESSVIRLLRNDSSLLYGRTQDGQTSFHLAANWPRGLSILIEYAGESIHRLINIKDTFELTVIEYAFWLRELDSVHLLLDARANIPHTIFDEYSSETTTAPDGPILYTLIESLVLRRKELLNLALRCLSSEVIGKLNLEDNLLLDHEAFDVAEALRQQQIPIPAACDTLQPGSVYHWRGMTPFIAQTLYDAGFHKTNTAIRGYIPLMTVDFYGPRLASNLELISWFEDHGTNIHAPIPVPEYHALTSEAEGAALVYPAIHRLSHMISWSRRMWVRSDLRTEHLHIFSKLLKDEFTDPCLCYCTIDGCTSASKYAREIITEIRLSDLEQRTPETIALAEQATSNFDGHTIVLGLIRVMTFGLLGMRHTCCIHTYRDLPPLEKFAMLRLMDPEEVNEIREEDQYLAELLETLMEEFEAKFLEMKVPLSKFVMEYWWPRMKEVEKEREELSSSDLHAIREIGVVLDES
ncbi:hypothetical protein F4818DRAFT_440825 [Hypoxylon cercidicola]|nr:hypothetical protein F4818DRAFT_440825 [Hypoxylon cercidicola]